MQGVQTDIVQMNDDQPIQLSAQNTIYGNFVDIEIGTGLVCAFYNIHNSQIRNIVNGAILYNNAIEDLEIKTQTSAQQLLSLVYGIYNQAKNTGIYKNIVVDKYNGNVNDIINATPNKSGNTMQKIAYYIQQFHENSGYIKDFKINGVYVGVYLIEQMVIEFKTTSANTEIILPLQQNSYVENKNITVSWGDDTQDNTFGKGNPQCKHTYADAGTYVCKISGQLNSFGLIIQG